jgi:Ca2+-binding EF-hand superfamily protein
VTKEFDRLSKDKVIGKRKLFEYFRMMELEETYLASEIFEMIKNSTIYADKFLNFVAIISKGTEDEKLELLYTFFDKGRDAKITKEDLKAHIIGTILSMQGIPFEL